MKTINCILCDIYIYIYCVLYHGGHKIRYFLTNILYEYLLLSYCHLTKNPHKMYKYFLIHLMPLSLPHITNNTQSPKKNINPYYIYDLPRAVIDHACNFHISRTWQTPHTSHTHLNYFIYSRHANINVAPYKQTYIPTPTNVCV